MPETIDYAKFYDEDSKYQELRKSESISRKIRLKEVDEYKNKYLSELVPANIRFNTILEVGCATGDIISRFPIDIPPKNRYGIDISPKNIEFAKNEYPDVNFFDSNFEIFLKSEGKKIEMDIIILSDILEHVENDVELLKMAGIYAKYVLVNIPMEKCWRNRNRKYGINDRSGHLRAYDINDVEKLIANVRLKKINFIQRYFCREPLYKKHLKERLLKNTSKFNLLVNRMPKYIILLIIAKLFYKWFNPSNFFGLLSK